VGGGFALAGGSWILGLALVVLFAAVYWPVIRREEEFLRKEFVDVYERYAQSVPLLIPRFCCSAGGATFQWKQYQKNREYEALLGYLGG